MLTMFERCSRSASGGPAQSSKRSAMGGISFAGSGHLLAARLTEEGGIGDKSAIDGRLQFEGEPDQKNATVAPRPA